MGTCWIPVSWEFKADSREKFGWSCKQSRANNTNSSAHNYLCLFKKISIGDKEKVILTRLVSYDKRMAAAKYWFSTSAQQHNGVNSDSKANTNIFVGDPVWNVMLWWEKKESIPVSISIVVGSLELKDASIIVGGESSARSDALSSIYFWGDNQHKDAHWVVHVQRWQI